jgi:hypothetical protein
MKAGNRRLFDQWLGSITCRYRHSDCTLAPSLGLILENPMKDLPKDRYDYWEKQADEYLTHDPQGLCRPCWLALRDAIFTIRERDREIETLKKRK